MSQLAHRRVLLKLSGEALMGAEDYGIDPGVIGRVAGEVIEAREAGAEIALVIGGGNIFRGAGLAAGGMDRVTGDQMGMLATVINALAMQDALEKLGGKVRVMSAIKINDVCEDYIRRRAVRHLEKGRIAIFAAGTGNPFFTTDSAAALRAIEIDADLLLKATKVDGVYDRDPKKFPDAVRFEELDHDEVIARGLQVMDTAAFALCRDHGIPLRVYDVSVPGNLMRILQGANIGTLVRGRH
ncbi:UMP kinase [Pseudoxanthomonas broegbernensis]|uniref:Uridylate kinase n=1 Tax=Pseudoxanthomonas broegbernensis TaxID=83619 RepID=A0A7V8GM58_9GAMM|nr:UMP kinase [Pseudoxanthomonas broegbernensis]KAF1686293.1 UMP kinase [Pseudoxanthomonas broegbernensis]MBB6063979.1 uridylate kinase [Pseudoxanthomonas broegbernensis]